MSPTFVFIRLLVIYDYNVLKVGDTRNQHLYVSRLYKRQERQNVAFENFQKNLAKEWA
jgi:hypothetical protein